MTSTTLRREAGEWNFCPHCARKLVEPAFGPAMALEDMVCPCCNRPWIACPCTPEADGPCQAEKSHESATEEG